MTFIPQDKELVGTIFNIATSALGGGILAYPYAYALSGVLGGTFLLFCVFVMSVLGNLVIVYCIENLAPQSTTYQSLMKKCLGQEAEYAALGCSILFCFGTCLAYLIFIGNNLSPVLHYFLYGIPPTPSSLLNTTSTAGVIVPHPHSFFNKHVTLVIYSLFFIFPLCHLRRLKELSYTCFLSIGCIVYLTLGISYLAFTGSTDFLGHPTHPLFVEDGNDSFVLSEVDDVHRFRGGLGLLHAIPLMIFSFQAHLTTPPLYRELSNRTPERMYCAIFWSMCLISSLYIAVGIFGYTTFGGNLILSSPSGSDILTMYSSDSVTVIIGHLCVTFIATFAFPMLHFVSRLSVADLLQKYLDKETNILDDPFYYYSLTSSFFFTALALALVIPSIEVVLALIGGTVVVSIMLFLPGFLVLVLAKNEPSPALLAGLTFLGFTMMAFGLFTSSLSITFFLGWE